MKNQYYGDVGNYWRYRLLRTYALIKISIVVNWDLADGRFTLYLNHFLGIDTKDYKNAEPAWFSIF